MPLPQEWPGPPFALKTPVPWTVVAMIQIEPPALPLCEHPAPGYSPLAVILPLFVTLPVAMSLIAPAPGTDGEAPTAAVPEPRVTGCVMEPYGEDGLKPP
ncbi:hypothetical protein A3D73_00175 [Candidatus Uhrbacteria bacterium RIFCSPHIGHO2_02_FULL_60_44]|nr:MAG: hypothetical protein A3D73_00175 [Candidatus Uhrbacteria bacterium RIFCSPHIGHO2_02_FULL_60_44]